MSQENVEIVRAAFEAWNAGDMNAFGDMLDPEVILQPVDDWPEPGPYIGVDAVVRFIRQLRDTWDAESVEATSDFVHAADRVVVGITWHGVGYGPQANIEFTGVMTVRTGKIGRIELFWDHAEALEAAGLSE